MARPVKSRKVCALPEDTSFGPCNGASAQQVQMTVDEYEVVRLIDLEGYSQHECAQQMHVGRTTVQGIYAEARRKIADALVNGKNIVIKGGYYRLCKKQDLGCSSHCPKISCKTNKRSEANE